MHGLFITGTGTEVGKTYVAALIARQLRGEGVRVGVYKPAASGCFLADGELVSEDAVTLWEAAGRPLSLEAVCPQRFAAPIAPHLAAREERAAREEGLRVDADLLRSGLDVWHEACDIVLVEGAGGLMSPLSDDDYNADLAIEFGFPMVVVAANRLGVINDTLQTLITASVVDSLKGGMPLSVAGVVLNSATPETDPSQATNASEIEQRAGAALLANVPWNGNFSRPINWQALAAKKN